jgi:uncharacterized membrane protein
VSVDTKNSIVIKKTGPYRGGTREWTNRYHFEGDVPSSDAHWITFADAIVAAEKLVLDAATTIVEAVGNDASSASTTNPHGDAVFEKTYSVAGTGGPWAASGPSPGDAAALVRYSTPARSTKNHPVYLFNYYHSCWQTDADSDVLSAGLKTALETYADHWLSGFSDGTENHERCGPRGAVATSRRVDPFVRHRDFRN